MLPLEAHLGKIPHSQFAIAPPRPAPMNDSRMHSTSNWRTKRARLAPIESRTAISRSRAAARANSKLARLAHVMSRTIPTIAINAIKG